MAQKKTKAASSSSAARVRKGTRRQTRTKAKTEARAAKLPNSFQLVGQVFRIFKAYWRPLLGIVVVYLLLNIFFASGISNLSATVSDIKTNLNSTGSDIHPLAKALSGFGALVGSAGASGSATGSVLQSVLFVIEGLVIIWALRQLLAGRKIGVKQAYYSSMYPLIPFLLIIGVIFLELIPITLGTVVLSAILTSAVTTISLASWIGWVMFIMLAAPSIYWVTSSIFALYIVTLPDMQPRDALLSARKLVKFRRLQVLPKVLFLPLFILLVMGAIIIPLIIFASFLVVPVFYFLSMVTILFVHAYLYCLYRGLIA